MTQQLLMNAKLTLQDYGMTVARQCFMSIKKVFYINYSGDYKIPHQTFPLENYVYPQTKWLLFA